MSRAIIGGIAIIAIIALAIFGPSLAITPPVSGNMPVTFTVSDEYSSTSIPDTCDLYIYVWENGMLTPRDAKLDLTSGDVDSLKSYKTGEILKIKVVDPTDTSYCTSYFTWTVPSPSSSEIENAKFKCDLDIVNMDDANNDGTMDWDPAVEHKNGTAVTASSLLDASNSGYTTSYVYWNFHIYNDDDDTGYINSYNFEDSLKNYAYLFIDISGTGWDSVSCRSGFTNTFSQNNHRYYSVPLTDDALSRDLDTSGGFWGTRDGEYALSTTFDFSGFEAGDNVTITYNIRYYSDWDNYVDNGSWGYDSAVITETFYVQY